MKYKYIVLSFVFLFFSCQGFLERLPTDFIAPENYYSNLQELDEALTGVYDVMSYEATFGMRYQLFLTIGTDETYPNGNQTSGSINTYQGFANDRWVEEFWKYMYSGVERANSLLANYHRAKDVPEDELNRIVGEAKFLRGFYYFMLVSNFGGVPLKLEPSSSVNNYNQIKKSSVKEVYEAIIKDMTEALVLLDKQTATKIGFGGRVSKSAVQGILARVYLHMAGFPLYDTDGYENARYYAEQVILSGEHALNKDYTQIFINYAQDKYDVKESIWEVEFWGDRNGNDFRETGRLGNFSGVPASDQSIGICGCSVRMTPTLFNLFETKVPPTSPGNIQPTNDSRRDWIAARYGYNGSSNPDRIQTVRSNVWDMHMGKWRREYELSSTKDRIYTPQNFPLLRYADVLLMYAEAENEINGPGNAVEKVNWVRRRAYKVDINQASLEADVKSNYLVSKEAFRSFIIDERSRELGGEFLRKSDLVRWGLLLARVKANADYIIDYAPENRKFSAQSGQNIRERDVYLPIPQYEINLNKKNLEQNEGW